MTRIVTEVNQNSCQFVLFQNVGELSSKTFDCSFPLKIRANLIKYNLWNVHSGCYAELLMG